MDKAIELALRTWYDKDHPLHYDPLHPAMGLVGEVGEWINLHKKHSYKPNFELTKEIELDELGDIWYYLRILVYQFGLGLEIRSEVINWPLSDLRPALMKLATDIYCHIDTDREFINDIFFLEVLNFGRFLNQRLSQLNSSFDELTQLNWQKLKPGSERGEQWEAARHWNGGK